MKQIYTLIIIAIALIPVLPQSVGDVIITEIGNNGTKKGTYRGGDYIELQVVKDGTSLNDWVLCDYSSPTSEGKERQGAIRLSGKDGSVFAKPLPAGTIILFCLDSPEMKYGTQLFERATKTEDGKTKIIVFPYEGNADCDTIAGRIGITGKDNVVLASKLAKGAAIDAVTWGRELKWDATQTSVFQPEILDNGCILYLKNGTDPAKRTDPANWVSTKDDSESTPGSENK